MRLGIQPNGSTKGSPRSLFRSYGTGFIIGPVGLEINLMHFVFHVIIFLASITDWVPKLRWYNAFPYSILTTFISIIPPLLFNKMTEINVSLYLQLIPYPFLCTITREAHELISVLYFSAVLAIYVQCGLPHFQKHAMIFICLFICVYTSCVIFMLHFFIDSTNFTTAIGHALSPAIQWGKEVTVLIGLIIIGVGFLMLERFIRIYSQTLLHHRNIMQSLETQNEELKQEMTQIHQETKKLLDVESPLIVAIGAMKALTANSEVDRNLKLKLRDLMEILSQNRIYAVDLTGKVSDIDVGNFLSSMVGNANTLGTGNSTANTPALYRGPGSTRMREDAGSTPKGRNNSTALPQLSRDAEKQIAQLISQLESWDFDVFELDRITGGHALYFVSTALLTRYGISRKLGIGEETIKRLCRLIEAGYSDNPFHNEVHAADVLQAMNYFVAACGLAKYFTDLDILAAIIACSVHDIFHPGLSNGFQTSTMSDVALTYNDRSVLENMHCSKAFDLITGASDVNIFIGLNDSQFREVRETILTMVLATDLAQHFDLLSKFKAKQSTDGFLHPNRNERLLLLAIAIKAADISNPCRRSELCARWADLMMDEFFDQGDKERHLGMKISAYMDREHPAEAKCQLGFIDYVVSPLLTAWTEFLPDQMAIVPIVCNLRVNQNRWKVESTQHHSQQSDS